MAAVDQYAQAVAKTSDRIDKAYDEIAKAFQEIKAIKNSDAYKAVSKHFVDGKAITGTSEDVKASWWYFQSQLDDLNKQRDFLTKEIDDLNKQRDFLTRTLDLRTKEIDFKQKTSDEIAKNLQRIDATYQEIKAIKNSDDYKALSKRFVWGKPTTGTSKDEEAAWCCYTSQLDDLTKQLNFYMSQNAVAFKKTDEVRKVYKRLTAARSARQVLTSFALFIADRYEFSHAYEKSVTFGDVMAAVGFHDEASIRRYFNAKHNAKRNYTPKEQGAMPIEDLLSEETWYYLVSLNVTVNCRLHEPLKQDSNNQVTVVLESAMFYPDNMREVTKLMGFNNVDIKEDDSDSGSSPEKH